jgi:hypothetical protein
MFGFVIPAKAGIQFFKTLTVSTVGKENIPFLPS